MSLPSTQKQHAKDTFSKVKNGLSSRLLFNMGSSILSDTAAQRCCHSGRQFVDNRAWGGACTADAATAHPYSIAAVSDC